MEEAEYAERVVNSLHAEPRGTLKVSVSSSFGTRHVAPALPCFPDRYSKIKIDLTISDHPGDLIEEGYAVTTVPLTFKAETSDNQIRDKGPKFDIQKPFEILDVRSIFLSIFAILSKYLRLFPWQILSLLNSPNYSKKKSVLILLNILLITKINVEYPDCL
ncbi:hypothetical protein [Nitrosomonas supralitoralis]|uniref:hypothetical protein n=1 Tax=Nitrosomonas supralitoralis TaxID=2116706 RepID=UPI001F5BA950|nr:hypothetical protein [Nitrosomonas supralitoralis]